jgi:hypothetical protein
MMFSVLCIYILPGSLKNNKHGYQFCEVDHIIVPRVLYALCWIPHRSGVCRGCCDYGGRDATLTWNDHGSYETDRDFCLGDGDVCGDAAHGGTTYAPCRDVGQEQHPA